MSGASPGTSPWSATEAAELYDVPRWGQGYFSVNEQGHLQVHPTKEPARSVDLKRLVDRLQLRGLAVPILIRFTDILKHRLGEIHGAFQHAINQNQYQGKYCCVYPIKVNQQRQVVEEVLNFGAQYGFGLEAGSKPELLAVSAMATNDTPIICNGFKDFEFIEMAMLAQKMGRQIIPVVEKYTELELVLEYAEKVGVRPNIGMRVKLAATRLGTLAVVRRLPIEVRPDGHRDPARLRRAEEARHGGLPQAAPLPPRQPDHAHPHHQGRARTKRPASTASWPSRAPA